MSELEETLAGQIRMAGLPEPVREAKLIPGRRFRCDFCWPGSARLVVECEGGTWQFGRHQRPQGFARDATKYNLLALAGWRVLRFTREAIESGEALQMIESALSEREERA